MRQQALQLSSDNRGFTLLEVLVSVLILAMVVTAVFELYSKGFRNISKSEEIFQAIVLAESALEEALAHRNTQSTEEDLPEGFDLDIKSTELEKGSEVLFTVSIRHQGRQKIKLSSAGNFYEKQ